MILGVFDVFLCCMVGWRGVLICGRVKRFLMIWEQYYGGMYCCGVVCIVAGIVVVCGVVVCLIVFWWVFVGCVLFGCCDFLFVLS